MKWSSEGRASEPCGCTRSNFGAGMNPCLISALAAWMPAGSPPAAGSPLGDQT